MKVIKIFGSIVIGLVALLLLVAAVLPSDYAIKREIAISKNKTEVFEFLKHLKNQDDYSVWAKMDPNMEKSFQGTDGTVGFISSWESTHEKVGKGEQEITKIVEGERIEMELRFFEPFEAKDQAYIATEQISENETKVTWGFNGSMAYPMNLFLLFMDMEKELGGALAEGLDNLKTILDGQPANM